MRERPIIFDAKSVRAILDGSKTQTRRVVKPQPPSHCDFPIFDTVGRGWFYSALDETGSCNDSWPDDDFGIHSPYGAPGNRLWVREACRAEELPNGLDVVRYRADDAAITIQNTRLASDRWGEMNIYGGKRGQWLSPLHMPRWASRITLEITDVRAERVQDISEDDAQAEGVNGDSHPGTHIGTCRGNFARRWDSINGRRGYSWASNPWVWVLEFRRVKP